MAKVRYFFRQTKITKIDFTKFFHYVSGTNGRLGLSHTNNVSVPRQMSALSQYVVKKVAVHSGGKHAMALTVDGKVFSWGEGKEKFRLIFVNVNWFYLKGIF